MEPSTRNKVTALCSDCAMPNDAEGVLTARQIAPGQSDQCQCAKNASFLSSHLEMRS
jgi:hypothetical protein